MSNLGESKHSIPEGRPPPADEAFYLEWGKENAKAFLANTNAALAQLLTLSSALLGGTIAFWSQLPFTLTYRFVLVAALLVTVLICLFSAMPTEGKFNLTSADDIRSHMEYVFSYKKRRLRVAQLALMLTLLLMITGLAFNVWVTL
jgi:hypothetical protein